MFGPFLTSLAPDFGDQVLDDFWDLFCTMKGTKLQMAVTFPLMSFETSKHHLWIVGFGGFSGLSETILAPETQF